MARIAPRIPDVVGKMIDSAISALAFTRLPIVRVDIVTTAQPTDHVVEQRPGRGTLVTATKAETLFVSARRKVPTPVFVSPAKGVAVPPATVDEVAKAYAALPPQTKSSMLEDLERGRRLELPWLSGAVVRIGEEVGVATPIHRFIAAVLKPHVNGRGADAVAERTAIA